MDRTRSPVQIKDTGRTIWDTESGRGHGGGYNNEENVLAILLLLYLGEHSRKDLEESDF